MKLSMKPYTKQIICPLTRISCGKMFRHVPHIVNAKHAEIDMLEWFLIGKFDPFPHRFQ